MAKSSEKKYNHQMRYKILFLVKGILPLLLSFNSFATAPSCKNLIGLSSRIIEARAFIATGQGAYATLSLEKGLTDRNLTKDEAIFLFKRMSSKPKKLRSEETYDQFIDLLEYIRSDLKDSDPVFQANLVRARVELSLLDPKDELNRELAEEAIDNYWADFEERDPNQIAEPDYIVAKSEVRFYNPRNVESNLSALRELAFAEGDKAQKFSRSVQRAQKRLLAYYVEFADKRDPEKFGGWDVVTSDISAILIQPKFESRFHWKFEALRLYQRNKENERVLALVHDLLILDEKRKNVARRDNPVLEIILIQTLAYMGDALEAQNELSNAREKYPSHIEDWSRLSAVIERVRKREEYDSYGDQRSYFGLEREGSHFQLHDEED